MRLLLSILCVLTSVQIVHAQDRTVNPTRMNVVLVAWRGVPDGRCEGFSRSHDQVGGKCSPVGASAAISGRRTGGLSREGERAARGVGRPRSNTRHRHSGLGLLTPEAVHQGRAGVLQAERQRVLEDAYARHPERFVKGPPQAPRVPAEVWINPPPNTVECAPEEASKLSTEVSHFH